MSNNKGSNKNTESTVFSDPKKKETAVKNKGKIVKNVLIAVVVVFVVIPAAIVGIAKMLDDSNARKPVPPLSSRIENTTADELAIELYESSVDTVTDIDATEKILTLLGIKGNCGEFTFEVITDKKPYKLQLNFPTANDASIKDWFETQMVKYSCALLALIDDIDEVVWVYPADDTGDNGGAFNRNDAMKLLNDTPVTYYTVSADGIQLLLTELGLEG